MTHRRLLAAAALLAATATPLAAAPPAAALSCVGADVVLDDATHVFTGLITDADDGRILVDVEEVWRGPVEGQLWLTVDLPEWTPWAGPDGTIPDGYSSPDTWLFARAEDGTVNACTAWPLDDALRQHRPEAPETPPPSPAASPDVRPPSAGGEPDRLVGLTAAAGGLATMLVVAVLIARSRRGAT